MAAYGAVVSLMSLIERVQEYNACNQVFGDKHLKDLKKKVLSLQDFLESYSSKVCEDLEYRIADAANVVEDLIESRILVFIRHCKFTDLVGDDEDLKSDVDVEYDAEDNLIKSCIADDIRALCVTTDRTYSTDQFSQVLQEFDDHFNQVLRELIGVVDHIKKEASKIEESASQPREEQHSASADSHKHIHVAEKDLYGDALNQSMELMSKLRNKEKKLQIFSITGMGGIGKTTLAQTVYHNNDIGGHFDVRGWVTLSQELNPKHILIALLRQMNYAVKEEATVDDFGVLLHKHLCGRRYLIVIDDIWGDEEWDWSQIKRYLPDTNQASRIIVTTRGSNLGKIVASSHNFKLNVLDKNDSWSLLKTIVFPKDCPPAPELEKTFEETGKEILQSCKGLPISIAVIGGLLAAKFADRHHWKSIAHDVKKWVHSEVTDPCLGTSYHHLPVHLKPCFLYLGAFPEDCNINVSDLIYLWVARGFLKPQVGKTLEEVGYGYLRDLVQRNLVIVSESTIMGRMKSCKIHDLLRDLCLRKVKGKWEDHIPKCDYDFPSHSFHPGYTPDPLCELKPLRVWKTDYGHGPVDRCGAINARYLQMLRPYRMYMKLLWNVQTINAGLSSVKLPSEIWEMPQLRHLVKGRFFIIEDPKENGGNVVLRNLQTLKGVYNFRCSEVILKKIPNLKKLKVFFYGDDVEEFSPYHVRNQERFTPVHVKNLGSFEELESLSFHSYCLGRPPIEFESALEFSKSIKKLRLELRRFDWEDMGKKIGSLPKLEKLELKYEEGGEVWNTVDCEKQFSSLRYLFLSFSNLTEWEVESEDCLPRLEHLVLWEMRRLKKIPTEIGDIDTLESIRLYGCNDSVNASGKEIKEKQHQFGLQVHIAPYFDGKRL